MNQDGVKKDWADSEKEVIGNTATAIFKESAHMHAKTHLVLNIICSLALSQCQMVCFNINYYSFPSSYYKHSKSTLRERDFQVKAFSKHSPDRNKCLPKWPILHT